MQPLLFDFANKSSEFLPTLIVYIEFGIVWYIYQEKNNNYSFFYLMLSHWRILLYYPGWSCPALDNGSIRILENVEMPEERGRRGGNVGWTVDKLILVGCTGSALEPCSGVMTTTANTIIHYRSLDLLRKSFYFQIQLSSKNRTWFSVHTFTKWLYKWLVKKMHVTTMNIKLEKCYV